MVRLKIGDPFLFGRGGEEVLEYRKYGVEPKVRAATHHSAESLRYEKHPWP